MAEYKWPEAEKRSLIGKRISRIDGAQSLWPGEVFVRRQTTRVLYARMLRSPHAHAKIVSIDISAAEKMPA